MSETSSFKRSSSNKMIAGVCGGLARQFGIDANLVRVIFAIAAFWQIGWVAYAVLWLVLPSDDGPSGLESLLKQFGGKGGSQS